MRAIIRVRHHRKVLRHVDPGDEDWFYVVPMSRIASEGYPGVVMTFRIFFKSGLMFDVFSISAVLGDQGRSLFLGELKREADAGFQESIVTMRNTVGERGTDDSYGVTPD
jgi:hypothetical protein